VPAAAAPGAEIKAEVGLPHSFKQCTHLARLASFQVPSAAGGAADIADLSALAAQDNDLGLSASELSDILETTRRLKASSVVPFEA
jgi:hypothetical protein